MLSVTGKWRWITPNTHPKKRAQEQRKSHTKQISLYQGSLEAEYQ
jgi:hypothetical protein